eukprot:Tbor_TRINITY_DN6221_c4_g6::TRINITY_DN6221_c4_g6_i1::g.2035::m.2035
MKLFQLALLLLVQLSPIFVHGKVETVPVYECAKPQTESVTVSNAGAQLTKGCEQRGNDITFDLKAMYAAAARKAPKTPVEISITEAAFINSYIKLTKAHDIHIDAG